MNKLDQLLMRVEKPSRYIGEEMNMFRKDLTEDTIRYAFAFPDVYEVGMSHLGLHILYGLLNSREDLYCERVFAPGTDLAEELKKRHESLFSLETKSPLKDFDFIGFTLQYELSYTNILYMLSLADIPYLAEERTEEDPIIMAGGPCAFNPEPLVDFIDLFVIGEGEEVTLELMDLYKESTSKEDFLQRAAQLQGVYVPKFYQVHYDEAGKITGFEKKLNHAHLPITKRIIEDLDKAFYPDKVLVPYMDVVHDRAIVELFRGCTKGCRFCQAGMIYRPVRERSKDTIKALAKNLLAEGGFEELALSSLSTLDYSDAKGLISELMEELKDDRIGISLPSLRLDSFSVDVLKEIQKVRKTSLTFAPEAGSQRMRDVINKGVDEDNLYSTVAEVFKEGWDRIKLYFMIGLPTEEEADLQGIVDIAYHIKDLYQEHANRKRLTLTISTSCFVPKPFTPFQWMKQNTIEEFTQKEAFINQKIRGKMFNYIYHDANVSYLEGIFARGDRRLGKVIAKAFEMGAIFDGWNEFFDYDRWMKAFEATEIDPHFYTMERSYEDLLPWDLIDPGIDKRYLQAENERAKEGKHTRDCRLGCTACGLNTGILGGVC